jgi:hypothetical protein
MGQSPLGKVQWADSGDPCGEKAASPLIRALGLAATDIIERRGNERGGISSESWLSMTMAAARAEMRLPLKKLLRKAYGRLIVPHIMEANVRMNFAKVILGVFLLSSCAGADEVKESNVNPISKVCSPSVDDENQKRLNLSGDIENLIQGGYYITSSDVFVVNAARNGFQGVLSRFPSEHINRTIRIYGFDGGCYLQISAARVDMVNFQAQGPRSYLSVLYGSATSTDIMIDVSYWAPGDTLMGDVAILRGKRVFFGDQLK